jgi:hypothetical protein
MPSRPPATSILSSSERLRPGRTSFLHHVSTLPHLHSLSCVNRCFCTMLFLFWLAHFSYLLNDFLLQRLSSATPKSFSLYSQNFLLDTNKKTWALLGTRGSEEREKDHSGTYPDIHRTYLKAELQRADTYLYTCILHVQGPQSTYPRSTVPPIRLGVTPVHPQKPATDSIHAKPTSKVSFPAFALPIGSPPKHPHDASKQRLGSDCQLTTAAQACTCVHTLV